MTDAPFSGSYEPGDVTFLLKVIDMPHLGIDEREWRIQSGQSHYSEMIGPESPPTEDYLDIFQASLKRNLKRLSVDLYKLAYLIAESRRGPIALVSIARSGTPVGVILGRIIRRHFNRQAIHYSISVIRDRGIDGNALNHILASHEPSSVAFIDGWTGKGVIAGELNRSVTKYNHGAGVGLDPSLAVISDPAGVAGLAVGVDDWLIPTCLLNSVVSGLISRTILNPTFIGPGDYHGCLFYENLYPYDLSKTLTDTVMREVEAEREGIDLTTVSNVPDGEKKAAAKASRAFIEKTKSRFGITDENHIKPGLGEATRVLLRRSPELLMVKDLNDPDLEHAFHLAQEKKIPVEPVPDLPYRAAAIIKKLEI